MAIAVQMDYPGGTLAQYDQVLQKLGFRPGGSGDAGGLFHWVAKTADGIRIVDVWESREQFEKFTAERVGPLSAQIGFTQPPRITFFEVHNYLTRS